MIRKAFEEAAMNHQDSDGNARDGSSQLLVFYLGEFRYALRLVVVERIFHAVEITPLPKAPEVVMGAVNVRGRIIPVVSIRKRFGLEERDLIPEDRLILAKTQRRPVGLVVDSVAGVFEYAEPSIIAAREILPSLKYVEGVARLADGMILIHDLDRFLSLEEGSALDEALKSNG